MNKRVFMAFLGLTVAIWVMAASTVYSYIRLNKAQNERWPEPAPIEERYSDSELMAYYTKFIKIAGDYGSERARRVFIHFAADEEFIDVKHPEDGIPIGICYPYKDVGIVTIRTSYWQEHDDARREALVFHELGHCYLDILQHRDTLWNGKATVNDGMAMPRWGTNKIGHHISLMHSVIMPTEDYVSDREWYLKELFDEAGRI